MHPHLMSDRAAVALDTLGGVVLGHLDFQIGIDALLQFLKSDVDARCLNGINFTASIQMPNVFFVSAHRGASFDPDPASRACDIP